MNIRKIKPLIEWLVEMGFTDIEIKEGEESLKVGRNARQEHIPAPAYVQMPPQISTNHHHHMQPVAHIEAKPAMDVVKVTGHKVCSPMVGTLYTSSSPDAPPFASIGKSVKAGDTLCIIEAMKMFNEIESDRTGVIVDILVKNGDPVEYDQPLFIIE
jgi:acetyl-CoA carboxylase biotin carboxyl carrier protein